MNFIHTLIRWLVLLEFPLHSGLCFLYIDCLALPLPAVWEKIKSEKGKDEFKADVDEECEDSLGNVISKKTYEMLRINGLL